MRIALVLALLVSTSVMAQEELPELPEQPSQPPVEQAPAKPKKKKAPRVKKRAENPKVREPSPPPPVAKAPRRKVRKVLQPRPGLLDYTTQYAPLTTGERIRLSLAQTGCAVVGVGATVMTAAGAGLLARSIDRPAGRLYAVPVQLGGLLPVTIGMMMSGVATVVCIAGLGSFAERRIAAPAAAMVAWSAIAALGSTVALGAIFWPATRTAQHLSIRENIVAGAVIGMAVLAPLGALIAYQLAAVGQQYNDEKRVNDDIAAARFALEEDAKKPKPPPPPPPVTTETPAPTPPPAPEPEPAPPPPPDIPAEPTTTDRPPVVLEEPIPAEHR